MDGFKKEDHPLLSKKATTYEPDPKPGKAVIFPLVMVDLAIRSETGKTKYGTYLESENSRDGLNDAYQEILDLVVYVRQEIEEREVLFTLLGVNNMTDAIETVKELLGLIPPVKKGDNADG